VNTAKSYIAGEAQWNYDIRNAPTGVKCLLLNAGGVALIGSLRPSDVTGKDPFFKAWSPLPKRDKEKEEALGILI
jgi:hypothetical protein